MVNVHVLLNAAFTVTFYICCYMYMLQCISYKYEKSKKCFVNLFCCFNDDDEPIRCEVKGQGNVGNWETGRAEELNGRGVV